MASSTEVVLQIGQHVLKLRNIHVKLLRLVAECPGIWFRAAARMLKTSHKAVERAAYELSLRGLIEIRKVPSTKTPRTCTMYLTALGRDVLTLLKSRAEL